MGSNSDFACQSGSKIAAVLKIVDKTLNFVFIKWISLCFENL